MSERTDEQVPCVAEVTITRHDGMLLVECPSCGDRWATRDMSTRPTPTGGDPA